MNMNEADNRGKSGKCSVTRKIFSTWENDKYFTLNFAYSAYFFIIIRSFVVTSAFPVLLRLDKSILHV